MKKTVSAMVCIIICVLSYLTYLSASRILAPQWHEPLAISQHNQPHRILLITQDSDTPFWNRVAKGAASQADRSSVRLEVLGNYGKNNEAFLSNLELGIHSKVDGILVQGLDHDAFKELTKIKAAFYSIPVITIAEDVPMEESLRRTYVGSDQFEAGRLIGEKLITDMGTSGKVSVIYDQSDHHYQKRRIEGVKSVLMAYPEIEIILSDTESTQEKVMATTQNLLNTHPDVEGFISINAELTPGMVQEIDRRRQIDPLFVYSFDDHAEIELLLDQGKLDAVLAQDPEQMGEWGVELILDWLDGETAPLDFEGYITPIKIVESKDDL